MIKYKLTCKECKKKFDSWFSSSKEFERLKKMKLINCNYCNSFKVIKSLMAPNVLNNLSQSSKNKNSEEARLKSFKREMKKYQNFIKNNLEYVGENFAYEARLIHYNSKKKQMAFSGKLQKNKLKS